MIVFDLETLGTGYNALIVQIGAVSINTDRNVVSRFCRHIKPTKEEQKLFEMDYNTVVFWLSQNENTIQSVFKENEEVSTLKEALFDFGAWYISQVSTHVYSHATFDPPILANAYKTLGMDFPIPFRYMLDLRTIEHLSGLPKGKRTGTYHNALDDAEYYANYLVKAIKHVKGFYANREKTTLKDVERMLEPYKKSK